MQVPYRKLALLLVDGNHGVYEINIPLRLEYTIERHRSAICVPKRERSVGVPSNVTECRRRDHRVIKGSVEYLLGFFVFALDLDLTKLIVPCLVGSFDCCVKLPSRHFRLHVCICSLHAHRRQCDLHKDLLVLLCVEICMRKSRHGLELVLPYLNVSFQYFKILERL